VALKVVKGRVTPLFVHPGFVPVDFQKALADSQARNHFQTTFMAASDARINNARTAVVEAFLNKSDAEWAWFLDTDMVFGPDILPRLLQTAKEKKGKVVAGLCFIYAKSKGAIYPNIFMELPNRKPGQKRYMHAATWPDEPFEVDGTGGACLLVHREVLQAVEERYKDSPYPWQDERVDEATGTMEGEDLVFCQKIKECGYKIWYDPHAEVGHLKEVVIGSREYWTFVERNKGQMTVHPDPRNPQPPSFVK
jgi:GT2 family glycosyltransferase